MEIFKVVFDGIKLSSKESAELSAGMEKMALEILRRRPEPPSVKAADPHRLIDRIPSEILGRILYESRIKEEDLQNTATHVFGPGR